MSERFYVRKVSLFHKAGSKAYHILVVTNMRSCNSTIFFRYGKKRSWGTVLSQNDSQRQTNKMCDDKVLEKQRRDYRLISDQVQVLSSNQQVIEFVGPGWVGEMSKENIKHHIAINVNSKPPKPSTSLRFDEDGNRLLNERVKPLTFDTSELEQVRKVEINKKAALKDQLWGIF
jgi:hypothetical protein